MTFGDAFKDSGVGGPARRAGALVEVGEGVCRDRHRVAPRRVPAGKLDHDYLTTCIYSMATQLPHESLTYFFNLKPFD